MNMHQVSMSSVDGRRWMFALLAILFSTLAAAENLKLVANYWAPLTGKNLPKKGLATEIVVNALARAGYKSEVVIEPWARALANVYSGKYDGIIAIWSTDERKRRVSMSTPYFNNRLVFIKHRDSQFRYTDLVDLNGLTVGIGRGYDYTQKFMSSNHFSRVEMTHSEPLLKMLAVKRLDLVLMDETRAKYYLRSNHHLAGIARDVDIVDNAMSQTPLHFGMSKLFVGYREVIGHFNDKIREMDKDGSINRLISQRRLHDTQ